MSELDSKIVSVFGDAAVEKSLARLEVVSRLPRFIAEYLVSKYYKKGEDWVKLVTRVVQEYYPDPKDKELVLNKLLREGRIKLIDEFRVSVDLKRGVYVLYIPNLQIYNALADPVIVEKYERILSGLWGVGVLEHASWITSQPSLSQFQPIMLVDFEPFQVYNLDLGTFLDARREFTKEEWVDLLVRSIGLNPAAYSWRQKLLLLTRLVPLCECNVNIMELGPRATGKTYLYRNVSYYTRIYSGGTVSAAVLFYNAVLKKLGDIGLRDAVVFDEVARIKFRDPDEIVPKLKDYMADGHFERASLPRAHSTCSLVFMGNVELEEVFSPAGLISYLPDFMKDSAMLDRVHGLLPGWELPKITSEHLARGYGLAADFFSEVLHRLRDISFRKAVEDAFELAGGHSVRDWEAVKRVLSGLIKLVFPHGEFDRSELVELANIALELRQRVMNLLSQLSPSEYPQKRLEVRVRG
ncbi:MAG: BREX system Lon protease-like protein BrxL [Thermofilum sp.]|nr:BREX system Lon protease-like protein BrxL [Thermofilum sp.]